MRARWTDSTVDTITLYRGITDIYWNFVRIRIWIIKEPTWQFGDINQDGVVDVKDLAILSKNYGKTFSLLSLTGIIGIANVYTYKKRKKQPE
jgi:glutathione peroxidase-family protein